MKKSFDEKPLIRNTSKKLNAIFTLIPFSIPSGIIIWIIYWITGGNLIDMSWVALASSLIWGVPIIRCFFACKNFGKLISTSITGRKVDDEIAQQNERLKKIPYVKIENYMKSKVQNIDVIDQFVNIPESSIEVLVKADEHFDFVEQKNKEMKSYLKNALGSSGIKLSNTLNDRLSSEKTSLDEVVHEVIDELCLNYDSIYDIEQLLKTQNHDVFFKNMDKFCDKYGFDRETLFFDNNEYFHEQLSNTMSDIMSQYAVAKKGYLGEVKVSEQLELYKDVLINLENIRFEVENTTVEADNIIIADNGVFCVETKNYGKEGESIVVTKDGQWKRFRGDYEMPMKNVTEQHNRHIGIMQRVINNELKKRGFNVPYIYFQPMFVIANDAVSIENYSSMLVVRASSIYNEIMGFNSKTTLSPIIKQAIQDIVLDYRQELKKYPVKDYSEIFNRQIDDIILDVNKSKLSASLYDHYIDAVKYTSSDIYIGNDIEENRKKYIFLK